MPQIWGLFLILFPLSVGVSLSDHEKNACLPPARFFLFIHPLFCRGGPGSEVENATWSHALSNIVWWGKILKLDQKSNHWMPLSQRGEEDERRGAHLGERNGLTWP